MKKIKISAEKIQNCTGKIQKLTDLIDNIFSKWVCSWCECHRHDHCTSNTPCNRTQDGESGKYGALKKDPPVSVF